MIWSDFFAQVKQGEIARAYLFTGQEAYVKQSAVERLRKALLPEGLEALNETILEGADAQQIIEACETLPFMADKRLVLVRDWAPLMPGRTGDDAQAERMKEWLTRAPDSCCVVFFMREGADMRRKAAMALLRMGAEVKFDYLPENELAKWLRTRAAELGGSIAPDAASHLVFLAGQGLNRLSGEMEKLTAYAGPGGAITKGMVETLVAPSLEARVFQMIDSLMAQNLPAAMGMTKTMLEAGESRIGILAMITRQMRLMAHIKRLLAEGRTMPQIEAALGVKGYPAKRMAEQAKRFTLAQLENGYRACVDADYRIKSGQAREDAALDQLLIRLS